MWSEKLSMIVALAALVFARTSLAAPVPEPTHGPRTVAFEVDASALGDRGIGLDEAVRRHVEPRLEAADFELVGADQAAIVLRLRFRVLQSGDYDWGMHFEFVDEGQREPAIEWVDCHTCVDATLMLLLDDRMPALLMALNERARELGEAEPVVEGPNEPEPVEPEPVEELEPLPKPITGLGIGGSVVAGLGIGAIIAGAVELSRGEVVKSFDREQRDRIDHRPPGIALLSVGGTALVAGAVLLGVDLARQAKKRKRAQALRGQVFPILIPDGGGLGIEAEF